MFPCRGRISYSKLHIAHHGTAEQGALIKKALEGAMNELFEEQNNEPSDVSAETSQGVDPVVAKPHPIATRRADALERVAETFLAGE